MTDVLDPHFQGPFAPVPAFASGSIPPQDSSSTKFHPNPFLSVVPAQGHVNGFDMSAYQEKYDMEAAFAAGFRFCYIKKSEGLTWQSEFWKDQYAKAKAAGFKVGLYHFLRTGEGGVPQFENLDKESLIEKGDLPPCLDFEWNNGTTIAGVSGSQEALDFLAAAKAKYGKAILYTATPYFQGMTVPQAAQFAPYPLWIAAYVSHQPFLPTPFQKYAIWQNTSKGEVAGIGPIDCNLFAGSTEDLEAFCI